MLTKHNQIVIVTHMEYNIDMLKKRIVSLEHQAVEMRKAHRQNIEQLQRKVFELENEVEMLHNENQ